MLKAKGERLNYGVPYGLKNIPKGFLPLAFII